MISIDFLTPKKLEGMEFIDFQNKAFANDLSDALQLHITEVGGKQILSRDVEALMYKIIEKYTGFANIKLSLEDFGNLSVDAGFFSPNHIYNIPNLDNFLMPEDTKLYAWFAQNSGKMFKGSVDLSTGKVEGAFKYIPVNLNINRNISDFLPEKYVTQFGIPVHRLLAGIIGHELGHLFGACATMDQSIKDNFIIRMALATYKNEGNPKLRIQIVKDASKLLDLERLKDDEIEKLTDQESTMLMFDKLVAQRNTSRALSLGVTEMSAEVMADAYAIRMGFDKETLGAIYVFYKDGVIQTLNFVVFMSCFLTILMSITNAPMVWTYGGVFVGSFFLTILTIFAVMSYFGYGDSGSYNAPQRRFEDGLRQMIARYKSDTTLPMAVKKQDIAYIDEMLKINNSLKPLFEGTVVKRIAGWVMNGGDFKAKELEHHTQALNNHEIILLSSKLDFLSTKR